MPNHLSNENSPYLLQHKNNPVDWYPWNKDALTKAQSEGKPIFLSIGYAACHWCHVMEHESFEDPSTAAIMNEHFINIKVDREERPDLDSLYMNAVVALTGQGGWPMSVFLTPDGRPFYGGTYFPPVRRYNMPAFKDVLISLANAWENDRTKVFEVSKNLENALNNNVFSNSAVSTENLDSRHLRNAVSRLKENYDWENGGWGNAPKFPQPMAVQFLLSQAAAGDDSSLDIAVHALGKMAQGGMYDILGGGFSRYSTDDFWLVPHFEKMLYDNALLAREYLHAFLLSGQKKFLNICVETIDFTLRELFDPLGGFYSSLDADSEGEEGKFYTWTFDEVESILGEDLPSELFIYAFGLSKAGNFEGKIVLQKRYDDEHLANHFNLPIESVHTHLHTCRKKLFEVRQDRLRPATDDKVLVSWNALMLVTLSEAARYLNRDDYLLAAKKNADFILGSMLFDGQLKRSWRNGKAQHNAFLEDYAGLILGLISLYQSSHESVYIEASYMLTETMVGKFYDPKKGFFDTAHDHENLFMRPKDIQDNAIPSGSSLAINALLQMSTLYDQTDWRQAAEKALQPLQGTISQYPTSFANWLVGLNFAVNPVKEIAIIGDPEDDRTQSLMRCVWAKYRPNMIFAAAKGPLSKNDPTLLQNRDQLNGLPTAYVCQNFVCKLPTTNPETLSELLD